MTFDHVGWSLACWAVVLAWAYRFINRKRHPARSPLHAFGTFVGIFGGITLATAVAAVAAVFAAGLEESKAGSLGPLLAGAAIIPAWRYAVGFIGAPPVLKR